MKFFFMQHPDSRIVWEVPVHPMAASEDVAAVDLATCLAFSYVIYPTATPSIQPCMAVVVVPLVEASVVEYYGWT